MPADRELRKKPIIWETPRKIAILAGAIAALAGVIGFMLGQMLGQQSSSAAPVTIVYAPPSATPSVVPTAPAKP
jgi:hypothetical protein